MSVSNGQIANSTSFNNAFLSRLVNTSTVGKVDLNNTDPASGDSVTNVQLNINALIQNSKIFFITENEGEMQWSAPSLSFSENIKIYFEDSGFINTVLSSGSPYTIADGESVYFTLDRTQSTNIVGTVGSTIPFGLDVFRFVTRIGDLLIFYDNSVLRNGSSAIIGEGSGGSGGSTKVTLFDPISTALPTGTGAIIDGVSVANGDLVLFTALSSDPNQVYQVSGVGVSLVWTPVTAFPTGINPTDGDTARVLQGDIFADQLAVFDGADFKINEKLRLFNGTDYVEINSLLSTTLTDATTDNVFTVNYLNSENIIAFYSLNRNGDKETGFLSITTDGTNAEVVKYAAALTVLGVSFTADISAGALRLRYTTTSTGFDADMKFFLMRWSDTTGGVAGPPSYTPSSGSLLAAGSQDQIQYNSGGSLAGSADFKWDDGAKVLTIGSSVSDMEIVGMQQATLTDNVASPTSIFSFAHASYKHLIIEASVTRGTNSKVMNIMVTTNGTDASIAYDGPVVGDVGITFFAQVSGADVNVQYTSTSTGSNATMKYLIKRWI